VKGILIVLAVTALFVVGIAGCLKVKSPTISLPASMKTYLVTGAHTPEAVLYECEEVIW